MAIPCRQLKIKYIVIFSNRFKNLLKTEENFTKYSKELASILQNGVETK